jgi:hypothetical protein
MIAAIGGIGIVGVLGMLTAKGGGNLRGAVLAGVVLIIVGLLVGPGGVSIFN